MMFNDMMHPRKIHHSSKKYLATVPYDENVGMQNLCLNVETNVIESYDKNLHRLSLEINVSSYNDIIDIGQSVGSFKAELIINGKTTETSMLSKHYKTYVTPKGTNFTGETYFNNIDVNKAKSIKINIYGNWIVRTSHGNSTITYPTLLGSFIPIQYHKTIKIK